MVASPLLCPSHEAPEGSAHAGTAVPMPVSFILHSQSRPRCGRTRPPTGSAPCPAGGVTWPAWSPPCPHPQLCPLLPSLCQWQQLRPPRDPAHLTGRRHLCVLWFEPLSERLLSEAHPPWPGLFEEPPSLSSRLASWPSGTPHVLSLGVSSGRPEIHGFRFPPWRGGVPATTFTPLACITAPPRGRCSHNNKCRPNADGCALSWTGRCQRDGVREEEHP